MEPNQPQSEPLPDLRNITKENLTTDLIQSLDKIFRPGPHEIQGMIQSICERKKWTRARLAAILRVNYSDLRSWEIGQHKAPGVAVFAIWHLYMMDTAPAVAFSVIGQATWGKTHQLPAPIIHHIKGEERKRVVAELRECKERMTIPQIADKYKTTYQVAFTLCKESGYRPLKQQKDKRLAKIRMRILAPESPWMRLDWRKKPRDLVDDIRASEVTIKANLHKLRHLPERVLLRHLKACNADLEKWEPILKYSKKISKKSIARIISEDNISADETKGASLQVNVQAEENQSRGCGGIRAEQEECNTAQPQEEVRGADAGNQ